MSATTLFNKNFVLLFQGQFVSQLGSFVYFVAIVFWIKHATDSATIVGLIAMLATIPGILLGPFGGTFADHFSRKKIIVIGDIINGLTISSIAALMFFSPESTELIITLLFIEAVINGTVKSVFNPAIAAAIPDIVPEKSVDTANGLLQSSMQIAMLVGQTIGGVVYQLLGAPFVMLIDGATYLLSALSESFISIPQKKREVSETWSAAFQKFKGDTREGLRYVQEAEGLMGLFLVIALINFFTAPFGVLLPFFVEDTLGSTPAWFGYIIGGMAVGSIIGSVLAGALNVAPKNKGKVVIAALSLLAAGFIAFAYSSGPVVALLILAVVGLCSGIVAVLITSIIQLNTPTEIRGRVFGLLGTLSAGLTPISLGLAGVIADLLDRNIPLIYMASGLCILLLMPPLIINKSFHNLMAFVGEGESAVPATETPI
jgi:DHA3 family macrolide efflux protein-like MFS transporter